MNKRSIFTTVAVLAAVAYCESPTPNPVDTSAPTNAPAISTNIPPAAANAPAGPKTISLQEMLVIGPSPLKLHALAMITQGKAPGGVDESFLPGFKVCSDDSAIPVRSVAARLLGQHFIEGKETPNPEALALLVKLAKDASSDVSYSAVYYGLSQIQNKSDKNIEQLIEVIAINRGQSLYERIVQSLENNKEQVARILDEKLETGDNIAIYEIYEDLTGKKPVGVEKYLDMPSSRPKMYVFNGEGGDAEACKADLQAELVSIGLQNPDVFIWGSGEDYALLLKTYITKNQMAVEKTFADHERFKITQQMWLTPELEIQFEEWTRK